jgi:formate/nitrite transporter FocA (FNT family)
MYVVLGKAKGSSDEMVTAVQRQRETKKKKKRLVLWFRAVSAGAVAGAQTGTHTVSPDTPGPLILKSNIYWDFIQ